ncbi:MAG: hypothetical protein IJX58_01595 [Clostridia bacterium]|nr:hypothetical protein [Clostridia bacterium]
MAKFNFFKNTSYSNGAERQILINKYKNARINLLIIIILTAINMIALATNMDSYFLFSANIPYFITMLGVFFCGMLPKDYYVEMELEGMFFYNKSFFVVMLIIAILILGVYFICWLFSKDGKVLWIKIALGLFIADTVLMLILGSSGSFVLDLVFHIWFIVTLFSGIKAQKALDAMPKESVIEGEFTEIPVDEESKSAEGAAAGIEAPIEKVDETGKDGENAEN